MLNFRNISNSFDTYKWQIEDDSTTPSMELLLQQMAADPLSTNDQANYNPIQDGVHTD